MSAVVLDASALLALFRDEPGAVTVVKVIAGARISSVNYADAAGVAVSIIR
jgi:ribonuclease VapC